MPTDSNNRVSLTLVYVAHNQCYDITKHRNQTFYFNIHYETFHIFRHVQIKHSHNYSDAEFRVFIGDLRVLGTE